MAIHVNHQTNTIEIEEQVGVADTPPAGRVSVYAKNDGRLYSKDSADEETLVSGASKFTMQLFMDTGADIPVTFVQSAQFEFTIDAAHYETAAGSISADVRIGAISVTSLNALSITDTPGSTDTTGANSVVVGDKVNVVFSANAAAEFVSLMLECTRT
jgi:hypothetical protein